MCFRVSEEGGISRYPCLARWTRPRLSLKTPQKRVCSPHRSLLTSQRRTSTQVLSRLFRMASKRSRSAEPRLTPTAKRTHLDAPQACTGNLETTQNATAPVSGGLASSLPVAPVTLGETISTLTSDQIRESLSNYALQNMAFRDFLWSNSVAEMDRRHPTTLNVSFDYLYQNVVKEMRAVCSLGSSSRQLRWCQRRVFLNRDQHSHYCSKDYVPTFDPRMPDKCNRNAQENRGAHCGVQR
ncbi:hypothetical protein IWX90DRAFT_59538 [Phyllosticta citrichinensis]|uniref:Uncharacterized protein n=1 Tax=Phyllosticta citrichinensis TaxID=1130410 RepID=A0ABR1XH06_9PEZI